MSFRNYLRLIFCSHWRQNIPIHFTNFIPWTLDRKLTKCRLNVCFYEECFVLWIAITSNIKEKLYRYIRYWYKELFLSCSTRIRCIPGAINFQFTSVSGNSKPVLKRDWVKNYEFAIFKYSFCLKWLQHWTFYLFCNYHKGDTWINLFGCEIRKESPHTGDNIPFVHRKNSSKVTNNRMRSTNCKLLHWQHRLRRF